MKPVLNKDGEVCSYTIEVEGKPYHCPKCGCNCFHKPNDQDLRLIKCNSCGQRFRDTSE